MYKTLLIFKYLRKRRIAWVSLIAVMLCTAMVIVVISVMGGWLRMFKEQFHGLTGEIIVQGESLTGFPHYGKMVERIEKLPEVSAAAPVLETFGLVNIYNSRRRGVEVIGYPMDQINKVNGFSHSLYRQYQQFVDQGQPDKAEEAAKNASFDKPLPAEIYRQSMSQTRSDPSQSPGMIVGYGVVGLEKGEHGKLDHPPGLYTLWTRLTVLPIDPNNPGVDLGAKGERYYWIVDDSRTRVYQTDYHTVYVPFDDLQQLLDMQEKKVTDAQSGKEEILPARAHSIEIGVKPGTDLMVLKEKVQRIVDDIVKEQEITTRYPIMVSTWLERQATFINAVEHEKALVTFLFGIISIVAIFLIFCIFYMIVVEKTKDIGIIKSVGATSTGVAGIFLGYGLAIGVVGSFMGLLAGFLIVHNINMIHEWMGKVLGIQVWDPAVYAFDVIPNTMNPNEIVVIMAIAIVASVVGALVPALRAARLHPVEALRWE